MRWLPPVLIAALVASGYAALRLVSEIHAAQPDPDPAQFGWLILAVAAVTVLGLATFLVVNPERPRRPGRRRRI